MGAKFSPPIANLYMGWWERHHIYGVGNPFISHIRMYRRYIDDLIFIADICLGALEHFLEHLNNNDKHFTGHRSVIEARLVS